MNPIVDLARLRVRVGNRHLLEDVSARVARGDFLLVSGPSGSGKSTMLRCLNGLVPQVVPADVTGEMAVCGVDPRRVPVAELARAVGFVFQNPETQLFGISVDDEVGFGPRNLGLAEAEVARRVEWASATTGIQHLRGHRLSSLSGGEKQRVAIASVLSLKPSLLVLDEPTAHLDVPGSRAVLTAVERLRREEGVSVVMGEHRTGAPGRVCSQVLLLDEGRVAAYGAAGKVFGEHDLIYRLGVRRPTSEDERPWEQLIQASSRPGFGVPPMASLRGVEVVYGKRKVLEALDIDIYPGEVLALVGDNGSGKTTVVKLLAGTLKANRGRVVVSGRSPAPDGAQVGVVMQNPLNQLFCEGVEDEVAFGPRALGRDGHSEVEVALSRLDLLRLRGARVHTLSCGEQQRTVVAAAIALRPRLLIMDEPTMGQDWRHLAAMMEFLRAAAAEGSAVLLVTHDYKLVHRYADRVALLRGGHVAAEGRPGNPRSARAGLAERP